MIITVLDKHPETTGDGKETGRIVVILGEEDSAIETGDRYVIGPHPGTEALKTGYAVNKLITPRQLAVADSQELSKQDPEFLKELAALEKTDPEAAKAKKKELAANADPGDVMKAMSEAWKGIDPEVETALMKQLFKYTSCPRGALNQQKVFDEWFQRDKLAQLKPLRDEVVEYNRFLDMMDGGF